MHSTAVGSLSFTDMLGIAAMRKYPFAAGTLNLCHVHGGRANFKGRKMGRRVEGTKTRAMDIMVTDGFAINGTYLQCVVASPSPLSVLTSCVCNFPSLLYSSIVSLCLALV